ncbi:MAG: c-type cytochrome [Steroidobacteraceae bacterium]
MELPRCVAPMLMVFTLAAAACSKGPAESKAEAQRSPPPGIRYEANISAGGVVPPATELTSPKDNAAQRATAGAGLFTSMNCDGCHGGGASGWVGPSLIDGRWRYGGAGEEIFSSIYYGRPKGMPAYGGVLGADGVWMLVSYLKSLPAPSVVPTTSYEDMDRPGSTSAAPAALH